MDAVGQMGFVNMTDEDLRSAVGALHEYCKRLSEQKEDDAEINALEQELKELKENKYGADLKAAKRRLSAARKVASLRGIAFKMPNIEDSNE